MLINELQILAFDCRLTEKLHLEEPSLTLEAESPFFLSFFFFSTSVFFRFIYNQSNVNIEVLTLRLKLPRNLSWADLKIFELLSNSSKRIVEDFLVGEKYDAKFVDEHI